MEPQPQTQYVYDSSAESKKALLDLAASLKSVSHACRLFKVSRSTFYEILHSFEDGGLNALQPKRLVSPGRPPKTSPEQEATVLEYTRRYPTMSYLALEQALKQNRIENIRVGHIRAVWRKHGLMRQNERLLMSSSSGNIPMESSPVAERLDLDGF